MVAQQILSILSALAAGLTRFHFEGFEINLVWSCGIFITMNPGRCQGINGPPGWQSWIRGAGTCVSSSFQRKRVAT